MRRGPPRFLRRSFPAPGLKVDCLVRVVIVRSSIALWGSAPHRDCAEMRDRGAREAKQKSHGANASVAVMPMLKAVL
jgi:hypothetical protein